MNVRRHALIVNDLQLATFLLPCNCIKQRLAAGINSNIVAFHAQAIGTDVVKYYEDDGGETVAFETVTLNEGQLYIEASLLTGHMQNLV